MDNLIKVRGARQHNLKNVDLDIHKDKLTVLTGVSGSGKSSFAFDTLYAEGQRRYVESLSTYARQFLGIMDKPDVDSITGLSPAISIDQKTTSRNPRSTVGTVTEVYDYLRLLFARVGHPHCPLCGSEISQQTLEEIVDKSIQIISNVTKKDKKGWFYVLAPVVKDRKGEFSALFDNLKAKGYTKVRVDGFIKDLSDDFVLIKTNKHSIDVVVDKITGTSFELRSRLFDSFSQSLNLADGYLILSQIKDSGFSIPDYPKKFEDNLFSEKFSCPKDNISLPEIEPRNFSFNSPHGACPTCTGLGKLLKVEPSLVFSPELSIMEGGILPFSTMFEHETWYAKTVVSMCFKFDINTHIPIAKLTKDQIQILLYGTGNIDYQVEGNNRWGRPTKIWQKYEGIVGNIERRYKETDSEYIKGEFEKYMRERLCESCLGARLKKESLGITINEESISNVTKKSIVQMVNWTKNLNLILNSREKEIAKLILKEIEIRLTFLISVGLEYLTLDRVAGTLSGGEAQRIRLASQIGSGLTGVLYVLDEPTIGLHQKDNRKLIDTLKALRDLGNTVVVVEHDQEMMKNADYLVDFGPGAGKLGGQIVAHGTTVEIMKNKKSITGAYLSGRKKINIQNLVNSSLLPVNNNLKIFGANQFNLKSINAEFPLGKFICITGVSGSGKSTLLVETLFPALQRELNPFFRGDVGSYKKIEGLDFIDKAILIDQSPIGRTPRSNPATYTGLFDPIRDVFSLTKESKVLGFKKGQFSFNLKGGRCEACEGQGQTKIEMQFMPDIWIACEVCKGKRYNSQTLEVNYKGKNIAEVLDLTITDALDFFGSHPKIYEKLVTLQDVGLGYMQLGQPATTLSGGEAQRVKLATELSKRQTGKTFYILDEPTTGLHFADVEKLLKVLKLLVSKGNTVCVIEHNLDVIKNSDWVIDLGPGGGDSGGEIIAVGSPKDISKNKNSVTGKYLLQ
ncbi:excinuclease ABC subunit A [Candidatus Woesebacteria bacterium RIFOXYC1_FULL_31_51]|nr:MAG: UvrA, excinuclease ABC subunit A [Candidatus Woesebacteria bacterium GW2011_GWF1_31_35]KKP23662.1 MAG: UvrABC system protein A [Candidatus Woesebacteria bacterium GW2011_GWC1_30_29]KKP26957.1 MAG: UvrABC system protein A [Candidatus Woesebacteria bacterium GW2011_GWD1_31_12]KKP27937.1 MAG: UvrABC system protein A [Candidatus Woesebacteria bacterium GW2011_GWB1_31_29]KKP34023.1 MAG: UvrABC system protein A [Candidatus Woesebacteria bacterium GW2011_GWF2_32_16]KKP62124.1 MAG: UvrABC syst